MKTYALLFRLGCSAMLASCLLRGSAADAIVLTIDPTRSSLTLSGTILGTNIKEQGAGSLTTSVAGNLKVELADNTIRFPGDSTIDPQTNGEWAPGPDGGSGSAPAEFGATATLAFGTGNAALRRLQLDLTSPAIPITDRQFAARGLVFAFPPNASASLDYSVGIFLRDSQPLAGLSTNQVLTAGVITEADGPLTVTLPIDATVKFTLFTPDDSQLTLKGSIVAQRVPTTPPTLTVEVKDQKVILRWSKSEGLGYAVQSSTDLVTWAIRSGTTTTEGDIETWTTDLRPSAEFYRLAK